MDVGLLFEGDDTLSQGVIRYVVSDYTGDVDKRRSSTRYVFTLSRGQVSWKWTLQSIVILLTIEVEYMANIKAIKEAIWFKVYMKTWDSYKSTLMCIVTVKMLFT